MSKISAPRGVVDALPAESWKWQVVERIAREVASTYHFGEIRTPIFEHTELFHRGVGEASDIVNKEMYTFDDRGGRSITLRPEQTAGVVRAMIESGALNDQGARSNARRQAVCASTTSSAPKPSAFPNLSRMSNASCCKWISTAGAACAISNSR